MEEIRLQKFLSNNGVDSRRNCEKHILDGKVKLNGEIVKELGVKINPEKDIVMFDEKIIKNNEEKLVYILLNKPLRIYYYSNR